MSPSGYTPCRCRDCFEVAISSDMDDFDFCLDCEETGCEADAECKVDGVYDDVPHETEDHHAD